MLRVAQVAASQLRLPCNRALTTDCEHMSAAELDGSFIHNYWAFRRRSEENKGILHLSLNKVSGGKKNEKNENEK